MTDRTCSVETCERLAVARTWCSTHWRRWRTHGDVRADQPIRQQTPPAPRGMPCSIDGCNKPRQGRTWCTAHLTRWRRHGDPLGAAPPRYSSTTCALAGCERPRRQRGWCSAHYTRWHRYGDPLAQTEVKTRRYELTAVCSAEGCRLRPAAWGWCQAHYKRWREYGDVMADVALRKSRPANPDGVCETIGCSRSTRARRCSEHGMPKADVCTVDGCNKAARRRDLCSAHHTRLLRYGDVLADIPLTRSTTLAGTCSEPGCKRRRAARGLCGTHYGRYRRVGRLGLNPPPTEEEVAQRIATQREYQRRFKAAEYARDPKAALARDRTWRIANPEKVRLMSSDQQRRRAAARKLPFTTEQLAARLAYWGNRCWMCSGPSRTIDHVKPIVKGGWHALMNLRPACLACNSRKGSKWPFPVRAVHS